MRAERFRYSEKTKIECKYCNRVKSVSAQRGYYEDGFCRNQCRREFKQKAGGLAFRADSSLLLSPEWMRLRYSVLLEQGRECNCCGSKRGPFHVDHIKPRLKYPHLALEKSNLQVLCENCNMGKGAWDETDWRS